MGSIVMDTTNELAKDFVGFKLGKTSAADVSMIARTLRRVAADVESNHGDLFQNMIRTIACSSDDISQSYSDIVKNMFSDNVINWGRIAVLFTFSGQVAIHCQKQGSPEDADRVISLLTDFVNTRLSNWIENAGGWVSFTHFWLFQLKLINVSFGLSAQPGIQVSEIKFLKLLCEASILVIPFIPFHPVVQFGCKFNQNRVA